MDKTCKNCRYHQHEDISDGYVCVNGDSDMCADWTEDDYSCDKWEMQKCCNTCRYMLNGKRWTYIRNGSVLHSDMDGFVCAGFAYERIAVQMIGIDVDNGICEMYRGRE